MFRFLFWRVLGLAGLFVGFAALAWLLGGGAGRVLRGSAVTVKGSREAAKGVAGLGALPEAGGDALLGLWRWAPLGGVRLLPASLALVLTIGTFLAVVRCRARRRRRYVRLRVDAYRGDRASGEAIVGLFAVLHKRLLTRWWRRFLHGQPSVSLEVHHAAGPLGVWFAVTCPVGLERMVETALQTAYPNCSLSPEHAPQCDPQAILRLKKRWEFIKRVNTVDPRDTAPEPSINGLITVMAACGEAAFVQLAMTPTPAIFERFAKHLFKRHEAHLSRQRREHLVMRDRSLVEDAELRGGLEVQNRPLYFVDLRVVAPTRQTCERIASELRADSAENHLVERGTGVRHGAFGLYSRRVERGEGNALPSFHRGVFASTELAAIWQLPSNDYTTVPFSRSPVPLVPAPPEIFRPAVGEGTLTDALGPVSIHVDLRRQNTAVPGTVEQGKSSYLVATVAEDLRRERCAVIVLDPKGDAADAAVSLVPPERTCTLLDFSHPTCGFNPLAVNAPADVIADYVVAALKNLFTDADIRASSDRYLRNAIIAVLAYDRRSTLWDAARLLSVGEEGYSYRNTVASAVRAMPQFKEIVEFFAAELAAQLADARGTTTSKLDAPVNKLARLLNSPSIKRVLLNDSLAVDFDRLITREEVLVVKGAMGAMGAGNTSVLMQLLVGMLDAALARQQDLVSPDRRVAVALKVDEAPLVLNRGFAETMALKRSAGLETVAAWQTDSQWTDRDVRDQLDALFAHRVYFATASTRDARAAVGLTMAEFSDTVRPGIQHIAPLGHPDVRLHLPKHHAIASWTTPEGRQSPFVAKTIPLRLDPERLALHAERQRERGGMHRTDLSQPHWDRTRSQERDSLRLGNIPSPTTHEALSPPTREVPSPLTHEAASPLTPEAPASPTHEAASPLTPGVPASPTHEVPSPPADEVPRTQVALPAETADSFRELVELDQAHSVRWAKAVQSPASLDVDPLDLEVLALIASLGHVLTTQIHRRFNAGRAVTTTQRRLKRLADSGLVDRFQFHRRDGGGAPMCYLPTAAGLELLSAHDGLSSRGNAPDASASSVRAPSTVGAGLRPSRGAASDQRLRQARHEVHVGAWALALERLLGGRRALIRGPSMSVISPPGRSTADGYLALSLSDLRLPGGRTPHDFLRTDGSGEAVPVERFETIRPDAVVELPVGIESVDSRARESTRAHSQGRLARGHSEGVDSRAREGSDRVALRARCVDVLVELDDRLASPGWQAKLERYDHFLTGWSVHTNRYGRRREATATVVFVCRDRPRARECARRADLVLRACRAYAGEYPADWQYPAREAILFVAERDLHEGVLLAYGVPSLPPPVRIAVAHGDPRAGAAVAEQRELPVPRWDPDAR